MPRCSIKFSQLILKGNVWRSVWRICMWILGLKGLKVIYSSTLGNYKDSYFINVGSVVQGYYSQVNFNVFTIVFEFTQQTFERLYSY